jgi:hypothetical protein
MSNCKVMHEVRSLDLFHNKIVGKLTRYVLCHILSVVPIAFIYIRFCYSIIKLSLSQQVFHSLRHTEGPGRTSVRGNTTHGHRSVAALGRSHEQRNIFNNPLELQNHPHRYFRVIQASSRSHHPWVIVEWCA